MSGAWWEKIVALGEKAERATARPATGSLFTISGGRILMTSIVGELTAACDANATASKLQANPTTGTTRNLCTAVDIASYAIGDLIGISGIAADALLPPATAGSIEGMTTPCVLQEGTLDLNVAAGGQVTGRVKWTMRYIALDQGPQVVAA